MNKCLAERRRSWRDTTLNAIILEKAKRKNAVERRWLPGGATRSKAVFRTVVSISWWSPVDVGWTRLAMGNKL